MPINFELPENVSSTVTKVERLHYIPANIDGNCKTDVANYFDNYTEKTDSKILTNAFRGFPLKGCEQELPEGKIGVIFRDANHSESSDRNLKIAGTFKNFTYWNYDLNPSDNDAYRKTISALKVMEAVHHKVD